MIHYDIRSFSGILFPRIDFQGLCIAGLRHVVWATCQHVIKIVSMKLALKPPTPWVLFEL